MDMAQGSLDIDGEQVVDGAAAAASAADEAGVDDRMFDLGGDERRMHVRAYNHWVSLLKGQDFPAIADLHPDTISDFGDNGVLLDFTRDVEDPLIAYLGRKLREECGIEGDPARITEVPPRSLLSRLTDHYLQIIANRAPIGFEAEFVSMRGRSTLYRGILMPFSSTGEAIDYIYGVINWKEIADPATQATLDIELDAAMRNAPKPSTAPVWADGPSGGFDDAPFKHAADAPAAALDAQLMMARESAAAARAADTRGRAALYRALGRAHDFALAAAGDEEGYRRLLAEAGIKEQARAPMTPVAKLVFGADYDKTRLTEFATVLGHARAQGVREGELPEYLSGFAGGIKAVVAEARGARAKPKPEAAPALPFLDRAPLARVELAQTAEPGRLVVLVARVTDDGALDVVGQVDEAAVTDRAVKALNR